MCITRVRISKTLFSQLSKIAIFDYELILKIERKKERWNYFCDLHSAVFGRIFFK